MLAYTQIEQTDELLALRKENAALRQENAELRLRITELEALVAKLNKRIFGKSSEKMTRPQKEIEKKDGVKSDPNKAKERRKNRDDLRRQKAQEVKIEHELPEPERQCPNCSDQILKFAGVKESVLYEFVPAHFERQVHVQHTWACPCCDYIATAPGADRPTEGGQYGAGLMSHVVVSKCADSIPLYRMEKQFGRIGIPMARSSLCNLFHQAANILEPIYRYMQGLVKSSLIVLADETPLSVLDDKLKKTRKGYIWTFLTDEVAYYRFSANRSGKTPSDVLENSEGTLLVDGYTGYNVVTTPDARERAGCWAHARREFFDSLKTAPAEAQHMLDEILELYRIEYEAVKQNILGTGAHTQLRKTRAIPILERIKKWLIEQRPHHLPKSPFGKAVTYALNQWESLCHYLTDSKISIDNNLSERRLRIIAIGRKNYLFAGHDDAAQNLAILQSIITTCEMHGVNPEAYMTDVLIRVQHHNQQDIADLLPHRWKELFAHDIPNSIFQMT
jgi:transposase